MRKHTRFILLLLILPVLVSCRMMPGTASESESEMISMATTGTTLRLLFVGDTSFGENYQARLEKKGETNILTAKGYDYSLSRLDSLLVAADHVVANLETTVTDLATSTFDGHKTYLHRASPIETPASLNSHHLTTLSLANNHTMDYGTPGLRDTLEALDQQGLQHFGAGSNASEALRPIHFNLNLEGTNFEVIIAAGFEYRENYQQKYDFYAGPDQAGVNEWSLPKAREHLSSLRTRHPEAFLIAYPHWGKNYASRTEKQTALAHALIDSGADLVIGHGSHAMQAIEQYRGRWILFGLGNFMFNSPGRYARENCPPFSLAAMLEITPTSSRPRLTLKLYPIFSDNRITNYRPRLVNEDEFYLVRAKLPIRTEIGDSARFSFNDDPDDLGLYLRLDVVPQHVLDQ